jgi:hypothetical protein
VWNEAFPSSDHADNVQPLTLTLVFLFKNVILHGSGNQSIWVAVFDSPRLPSLSLCLHGFGATARHAR